MLLDLARISGVSLELTASESPKFAVIVATIQGNAIAAEHLGIIFGRFYGVHTGGCVNTGLLLAVVSPYWTYIGQRWASQAFALFFHRAANEWVLGVCHQRMTLDLPAMGRFSIRVSLQLLETAMKFEVKDMSCGGCANAITQAITQEDAAASVAIDVSGRIVEVESAASQERLMAAIEGAGFHPTVLAS